MIIQSGPENAVSFTDDTSPDLQHEPERKVSIHAQVMKHHPLDWYYEILSLFPDVPGELKSEKILKNFPNLRKDKQRLIWSGLKRVRINIVDTLPHQAPWIKSLKEVSGRDDVLEMLRHKARQGEEFARNILNMMDEMTTNHWC